MLEQRQPPILGKIIESVPYQRRPNHNDLQKIIYRQSLNVDQFNNWLTDNVDQIQATEIHCQDAQWSYDFQTKEFSFMAGQGEFHYQPTNQQDKQQFLQINFCQCCSDVIERLEATTVSNSIDQGLENEPLTTCQDVNRQQLEELGWLILESDQVENALEQPMADFTWLTIKINQDILCDEVHIPSNYYKKNQLTGFFLMIDSENRHRSFAVAHCQHSDKKIANILKSAQINPDNRATLVDAIVCDCQYCDIFHRHQANEDKWTVGSLKPAADK